MVIKRDKDYKLYSLVYIFISISLLIIYVYGCNVSLGLALLINSPAFIIMILSQISTGRTFIMDESGCTVCFGKFRKQYAWEELKTKRIEEYCLPSMIRGRISCPYIKEAFTAPYKIRKPKAIRANLYGLFHPFSFIYINFSLENEDHQIGRYYEIEEFTFRQQMKAWGIVWDEQTTG